MTHPGDDVARNIEAQQSADGMPTDDELHEAKSERETAKEVIQSLVEEGASAGLIDKVFIEAQRGAASLKPNRLKSVAEQLGRSEEYEKHVKKFDSVFRSGLVRQAAEDVGITIEEESRPDPEDFR